MPSGCKSPLLKHVVSHRRQTLMILHKNEELELVFNVKIDDFVYTVYASSGSLKCYRCGGGHIARTCPEKAAEAGNKRAGGVWGNAAKAQVQAVSDNGGAELAEEENGEQETGEQQIEQTVDQGQGIVVRQENVENNVAEPEAAATADNMDTGEAVKVGIESNTLKRKQKGSNVSLPKKGKTLDICTRQGKQAECVLSAGTVEEVEREREEDNVVDGGEEVEGEREGEEEEEEEEECEDSQPLSFSSSQPMFGPFDSQHASGSQKEKFYEIGQVKKFLLTTKNMKNVQIDDHFEDTDLFVKSVRSQLNQKGEGCFTKQEVYRIRKWVMKLTSAKDDDTNSV